MPAMNGLGRHILAELYECDGALLDNLDFLKELSLESVRRSGATIMSHHFKTFEPMGVSGVIVIAESHLSFHTWPEHGYMALDYFTCGEDVDIQLTVDLIKEGVRCKRIVQRMHDRGEELAGAPHCIVDLGTSPESKSVLPYMVRPLQKAGTVEHWISEHHLDPETEQPLLGFSYLSTRPFVNRETKFQKAVVAENPIYGKMLFLDGYMMTTERDEFVYHEMLAHVPMNLVEDPRRVLIIGGGDLGLALRVLEHPTVERVDLVEIDGDVIEIAKEHFPKFARAAEDPRLHIHIEDGAKFVREAEDATYDVVLVDSTDPIGPGKVLFEVEFYENIRRILTPNGVMAAQSLSPWVQKDEQRWMYGNLGRAFPHVRSYIATVPTYPGGQWTFALASTREVDINSFDRERAEMVAKNAQYYTPEIQTAAFALPAFVKANTVDVAGAVREGERKALVNS